MVYYTLVRWEVCEDGSGISDNVDVLGVYPSVSLVLRDLGDELSSIFSQLNELGANIHDTEISIFDGSHPLHGVVDGASVAYTDTTDLFKQVYLGIHEVPFVQS